jgi:hypothetical protein
MITLTMNGRDRLGKGDLGAGSCAGGRDRYSNAVFP